MIRLDKAVLNPFDCTAIKTIYQINTYANVCISKTFLLEILLENFNYKHNNTTYHR